MHRAVLWIYQPAGITKNSFGLRDLTSNEVGDLQTCLDFVKITSQLSKLHSRPEICRQEPGFTLYFYRDWHTLQGGYASPDQETQRAKEMGVPVLKEIGIARVREVGICD
jgi:hypothetical protein